MRLPGSLVSERALEKFLPNDETAVLRRSGEYLVVDVQRNEIEPDDFDNGGDGRGWLDTLAPLRADAIDGDYRFFYLIWLMGVEAGGVADDEPEPLPGLAPLTPAIEAFADFFDIDGDLVAAAAAAPAPETRTGAPRQAMAAVIHGMNEAEKDELLVRLHEGDMRVRAERRRYCRERLGLPGGPSHALRTAGELRAGAARLAEERRREAEQRRREKEAAAAREARLNALTALGERAWITVEAEIARRNPGSYDRAVALLEGLCALALRQGTDDEFARRTAVLRRQHAAKKRFIERLDERFGSPTLV
jgi:hypothetical protein